MNIPVSLLHDAEGLKKLLLDRLLSLSKDTKLIIDNDYLQKRQAERHAVLTLGFILLPAEFKKTWYCKKKIKGIIHTTSVEEFIKEIVVDNARKSNADANYLYQSSVISKFLLSLKFTTERKDGEEKQN